MWGPRGPGASYPSSAAKGASIFSLVPALAARTEPVPVIVGAVVILILSLGVHEAAHGWTALKCGDPTARDLGRITLNPIVHIDPFMTIILPAMTFMLMGFPFGGAKPVPVNFYNLRRPYRDMAVVALAGPISNVLIAIFLQLVLYGVLDFGVYEYDSLGYRILRYGVLLNILLAAFNMLPIPPLDGSRIMAWLLPQSMRPAYHRLESFGLLLVIGFVWFFPGGSAMLGSMMNFLRDGVEAVANLGRLW